MIQELRVVREFLERAFSRKKHQKEIKQLIHIELLKLSKDIAKGATNRSRLNIL